MLFILVKQAIIYMVIAFYYAFYMEAKKYLYGMEEKQMTAEQIATAEKTLETVKTGHGKNWLPLNLQLFASSGDGGDGGNAGDGDGGATGGDGANGGNEQNNDDSANNGDNTLTLEAIEKIVQSRVDSKTADLGKTIADLKKENEKLRKAKLTDDEIKALEMSEKEKALTEKEQALLERENKLYAIKAIKEAELDDGSNLSLELIDFVMDKDEKSIDAKVKAFKILVDKFVTAKVDATFKQNGRTPNGSGKSGTSTEDNKNTSVAAELGKKQAEAQKKSNDILSYYYGGKK